MQHYWSYKVSAKWLLDPGLHIMCTTNDAVRKLISILLAAQLGDPQGERSE